ncbi:spore-associated protein A [Nocardiopsis sp. MG754419]|uniref:spore-associated protein A n=1 Tax=Nocardiopsis sp. MG754419 TaxID=2259865 RepID=UPI001BA7F08F|nr:spore-associated protein A [Nocardiopsis sp. MG754419]MBR8744674.1 spore-associated protein A [Nocardiopsis sp. MG754419]
MRSIVRRACALAATAGIGAASLVATAAPATAAATYNGACGDGYAVVNSVDLSADRGTVFLTYNNANGYNCVATVRTVPGGATLMEAMLRASGTSGWNTDSGDYTTYAGPVYVHAAGRCVDWGGTIGTDTRIIEGTNCG